VLENDDVTILYLVTHRFEVGADLDPLILPAAFDESGRHCSWHVFTPFGRP
jgi:hypothetical protein